MAYVQGFYLNHITPEQLKEALKFYKHSPDGQYDSSIVTPILEQVINNLHMEEQI